MALRDLIKANAAIADRLAAPAPDGTTPLLVLTDSEPALTGLLEQALGLGRGSAAVVRLAGAWGGRNGEEVMRSVTLALALHGCSEIAVVGASRSDYCPPDRTRLRAHLRSARLGGESETRYDLLQSPASTAAAVQETVHLLRHSPLVPEEVAVHGCMLDVDSGRLDVIDLDRATQATPPARSRPVGQPAPRASAPVEEFEMPALPEILLPELAPLDLDSLLAPAPTRVPKKKKAVPYGSQTAGSGPISAAALASAMPPPNTVTPSALAAFEEAAAHAVSINVPPPTEVRDTGLPDLPLPQTYEAPRQETHSVEARPDVQARQGVQSQASNPSRTSPAHKAPRRERVLDFEEEEQARDSATVEVDLNAGILRQGGRSRAIEADFLAALRKVAKFLAVEMRRPSREEIASQITQLAARGEPAPELLKLLISPVLKMGKKRYSVINELLRLKEDLPRQAPEVAAAILDRLLRGG